MAHDWQNWIRVFLSWYGNEIYRVEVDGVKKIKLYSKNYNFCECGEIGAVSWKIDILPITAWLKFESENSFAHMLLI